MLKKKLMAVGIAVVFTLSSLTTTVLAADFAKSNTGATVKFTNPGKGNEKAKNNDKKFKFDDLSDSKWALNAIEKLAGKGILSGNGYGKFAPKSNVTQIEALAMVLRLTGDNDKADKLGNTKHPKYNGIMSLWGNGYIYVAIEKGILLPEELKGFNPRTPAKRHEIAKYIIRAMGKTEEALDNMDKDLDYKDSSAVPDKSVGYVYLVNELNIMVGDNNNKFNPMSPVTRAEMAVLLDRAEGKFDVPDTDNRKSGIVFVSVDEDDNEITVTVKGVTTTFEYLDDVSVYKNNEIAEISDLVKGDTLKLYLNGSKKVIFIEVVKNVVDKESDLSFTDVSYDNLPSELQDEVDDLKLTENYKAYEYNDYIYLLAAMGKKNTGGYDIDIEKLSKTEDDDKYTITAVVYTDEPAPGSFNTQAITYPYSVVKFKSFDDIENVVFVDEDKDELDDVKIEVIDEDEVSSVEGVIYDLISSSRTIKVEKSNGTKVSYTIPNDADIEVNDDEDADFSDLEEGMIVELEIVDDEVTEVDAEDAEDEVVEVEGTITAVNTTRETIDVKKSNGTVVTLTITDDTEITVNDDDDKSFSNLEKGMKVEVEIINDEVTEVIAEDTIVKITGEIVGVSSTDGDKITLLVDGKNKSYTVASTVEIVFDGDDKDFDDLEMHDDLILTFENGTLVKIEIE